METDAEVVGIDSMNSYYDVELKNSRLEKLEGLDQTAYTRECDEAFCADGYPGRCSAQGCPDGGGLRASRFSGACEVRG